MSSPVDASRLALQEPNSHDHFENELADFQACLRGLNAIEVAKLQSSPDLRTEVVSIARKLIENLESPDQTAMRWATELGSARMAVCLAVNLGIFEKLWQSAGCPIKSDTLAKACGCEELFLVRIMRSLTAHALATEAGPNQYKSTRLTEPFTKRPIAAALKISHNYSGAIQARAHEYFESNGYRCPTSANNGLFQWYFKTDKTYFEYMRNAPGMHETFSTMMSGFALKRKHWSTWFPVKEEILEGSRGDSSPLVVDLGGSTGHDLVKLLEAHPDMQNRLVLQDLPDVVQNLELDGIHCLAHDFFKPQPIKGARLYYFHHILHDWPDDQAQEILRNVRDAMDSGYSKLYLNEHILPEQNTPTRVAALDLNMMCILGGCERSESHWSRLLESAGLKLVKAWRLHDSKDTEGIIEAALL